jgi:hypothetical protein
VEAKAEPEEKVRPPEARLPSTDPGTHAEHMPRNRQKCCGPA